MKEYTNGKGVKPYLKEHQDFKMVWSYLMEVVASERYGGKVCKAPFRGLYNGDLTFKEPTYVYSDDLRALL